MPNEEVLVEILECEQNTQIAHLILNSPETLNSLTLKMVKLISDLLDAWEQDSQIKMILISGSGEKAFCAGGDIRALYESMCDENGPIFAEEFFESEYRLDYRLHNYPKPIISLLDGIVMGGGAGLMFASSYKITTERTRFAMPEIGVGLFPDVGFTHEIKKLPKGLGLYIMLTATNLNAADTAFCKLTNSTLNSNDFDEFYTDIKQLAWVDNHDENIKLLDSLINQKKYLTNTKSFPKSKIKEELSTIQKLTKGDDLVTVVKNILSYDTEDAWYTKGKQTVKNGSPTSAHLIWLQCQNSSKLNLKEVFLFELNLAIQITRQGDFKEGVRALIIDKDNTPEWKFDSIENVSQDWIKEHIKLAWKSNPLEDI